MNKRGNTMVLILSLASLLFFYLNGCEDFRDQYFEVPDRADKDLYEVLSQEPEFSIFLSLLSEYELDTIFGKDEPLTLFIPDNNAFDTVTLDGLDTDRILAYHISHFVMNIHEVTDYRKVQTHFEKFATLVNHENSYYFDDSYIKKEGGYFRDGTYYVLDKVAFPKPSLYEYMKDVCPSVAAYIDYTDSIAFDRQASRPVGFDDEGNTIYDSVFTVVNRFERDFFPVREEMREDMATMLLFTQEQFDAALDEMALDLGEQYQRAEDIPLEWINEVLMPYFMQRGVFTGMMQPADFAFTNIQNIKGDTIEIDPDNINMEEPVLCSNGYVYNYIDLHIPQALYKSQVRFEGDELIDVSGDDSYEWKEEVVTSDLSKSPELKTSSNASGGTYVTLTLDRAQTEEYSIEFTVPRIFPNSYKFYWQAYYRPSGKVSFYVNGEKVGTFDNYNFRYPVDGINPVGSFNRKGFPIVIEEYGEIHVKMVYEDYGISTSSNGICLDYIELVSTE